MGSQQDVRLAQLQEISHQLVERSVLVQSTQSEVSQVMARWSQLNQKVRYVELVRLVCLYSVIWDDDMINVSHLKN